MIKSKAKLTYKVPEMKTAAFANSVDLDEGARHEVPYLDLTLFVVLSSSSQHGITWTEPFFEILQLQILSCACFDALRLQLLQDMTQCWSFAEALNFICCPIF